MSDVDVTKALEHLRRDAKQLRENKANAAKGGTSIHDMPYVMAFTRPETLAKMTPAERKEADELTHEIHSSYHSA